MEIAGFIKNSFLDYPGELSAVIFNPNCNMKCWYCHNSGIKTDGNLTVNKVLAFLETRKGFLDGVVFSGGEATLQNDLEEVISKVKALGFKVKLDTNGTNPDKLKKLIDEGLLDYIAMDIKAPLDKYEMITCVNVNIENIKKSIEIIRNSSVDYQFRTTMSPDLTLNDIREIAKLIKGAKKYVIQQYRTECYDRTLDKIPLDNKIIQAATEIASEFVNTVSFGI